MSDDAKPESSDLRYYANVEIMGHQQYIALVGPSPHGTTLKQVDVLAQDGETVLFTKHFGEAAIFCLTPLSRDTALRLLRSRSRQGLDVPWRIREEIEDEVRRGVLVRVTQDQIAEQLETRELDRLIREAMADRRRRQAEADKKNGVAPSELRVWEIGPNEWLVRCSNPTCEGAAVVQAESMKAAIDSAYRHRGFVVHSEDEPDNMEIVAISCGVECGGRFISAVEQEVLGGAEPGHPSSDDEPAAQMGRRPSTKNQWPEGSDTEI